LPQRGRKCAARQADLEELEKSAAAEYEQDPEAVDEVAEDLRNALRGKVAYELQHATVWDLQWSAAGFPTIMDARILANDLRSPRGVTVCLRSERE
jgi:hypothetical protein